MKRGRQAGRNTASAGSEKNPKQSRPPPKAKIVTQPRDKGRNTSTEPKAGSNARSRGSGNVGRDTRSTPNKLSSNPRDRGASSGGSRSPAAETQRTAVVPRRKTKESAGSVNKRSAGSVNKRDRTPAKKSLAEMSVSTPVDVKRKPSPVRNLAPAGKLSLPSTQKRRKDAANKTIVEESSQELGSPRQAVAKKGSRPPSKGKPSKPGPAPATATIHETVVDDASSPSDGHAADNANGPGRVTKAAANHHRRTPGAAKITPSPQPRSPKCQPMMQQLTPKDHPLKEQPMNVAPAADAALVTVFSPSPFTADAAPPGGGTAMGRRVAAMIFNKGVKGIRDEYYAIKAVLPHNVTQEQFKNNQDKNRYKDVICADQSRVILDGPGDDYIHASWVNGYSADESRKFICTQGPTKETCGDFWRMVHQYQCVAIVMLCQHVENNKPKCEDYYPHNLGGEKRYGDMLVRNKGSKLVDVDTKQGRIPNQSLFYTELYVEADDKTNKAAHTVGHWQWPTWPDKGVPDSSDIVFQLLDQLDPSATHLPIVVHCSAGIGRTGTLVVMDICRSYLDARAKRDESALADDDEVDFIRDNVLKIRRQRMLSIQTELQYVFVHRAIIDLCISRGWIDAKSPECVHFIQATDLQFAIQKPS